MATPIFNAKITLNSVFPVSESVFQVQFSVLDMLGIFSGLDVQINDLMYIDTSGSEPGTVTKYRVVGIGAQTASSVTADVEFADNNPSPIDPSSGIFLDGFIARPSFNGSLSIVPDPQTQILPNKFSISPQNDNTNFFKAPTVTKRWVMGEPCVKFQPLCKAPDGKGYKSGSDGENRQNVHAIALEDAVDEGSAIYVALVGYNLIGVLNGLGFTPGDKIFIGETPGSFVNDISSFAGENDSIIWVGWADCSEGTASNQAADLLYDFEVISRPG